MYQLKLTAVAAAVFLLCAGGAFAGGPPVVNETVHSLDVAYQDTGGNCATGNQSERFVTFSGVVRTLAFADGSYAVRGAFRGDTVFYDLPAGGGPADSDPDATAHFRFLLGDMLLPSGNALYSEVWSGTTTALSTDTELRFQITYKLVLDPAGSPRIEVFRFTCE